MKRIFKKEEEERKLAAQKVLLHPRKSLSDIVPSTKKNVISLAGDEEEAVTRPKYSDGRHEYVEENELEEIEADTGDNVAAVSYDNRDHEESEGSAHHRIIDEEFYEGGQRRRSWKTWTAVASAAAFVSAAVFYAIVYLPAAEITLALRRSPWEFNGDISALLSGGEIAAQLFSQTKNMTLSFPATGKKYIENKAKGTIKIYNAFSSSEQGLVANTRFVTPDGKVFRITKSLTVPGAKVVDGKITPAFIEAEVVADAAGEEYNIGPVERLTIPGFKGTPKYEAFYGVSEQSMSGGKKGESAFPTSEDKARAKSEAERMLRDNLSASFALQIPEDFTIVSNESEARIIKETVFDETDSEGKFRYFIEGKDERMAIRKSDLDSFLLGAAKKDLGEDFELREASTESNFKNAIRGKDGSLTGVVMAVAYTGSFTRKIDLKDLRERVQGRSEDELKALILSLPGVERADVSLWPFWVRTVPDKVEKITVTTE